MDFTEGSDAPRFFKYIHENTIREEKLMVPQKFVSRHGNCLSSRVTLEVPSGANWEVELLNNDGEIWLGEGWKEFSQHYSLEHGYMIFFKYVEDCRFHVIICDGSGLEIEYPDTPSDDFEVLELDMEEEGKSGIQLLQQSCDSKQALKASSSIIYPAIEASNNCISQYPSFKKILQPDHLEHWNMNIPFSFVQKHLESKTQTVKLQIADRSWPVKLMFHPSSNMSCLCEGFCAFARENSLAVGDVCVFELIKRNVFKVSFLKPSSWMDRKMVL